MRRRVQAEWKHRCRTKLNVLWAIPAGILVGELLFRLVLALLPILS